MLIALSSPAATVRLRLHWADSVPCLLRRCAWAWGHAGEGPRDRPERKSHCRRYRSSHRWPFTGHFLPHLWERTGDFLYDLPDLMRSCGLEVIVFEEFGPGNHVRALVGRKV